MSRASIIKMVAAGGLVLLGLQAVAASNLETVGVSREGDSVIVRISTSAGCEYNAFLTDSKPERIVVDLSDVMNDLEEKQFMNLPLKSIRSIRTSQFTVEPELQARVVLDIGRAVDFRSYRDGDAVIVKLPAVSDESQFAAWSSGGEEYAVQDPPEEAVEEEPVVDEPIIQPAEERAEESPAVPEKEEPAAQVAQAPPVVIDPPTTQVVPFSTVTKRKTVEYTARNLRDPFASLIGTGGAKGKGGLPSLENLKLVGILEDNRVNRALLEDSEGNGYILKPNDKIQSGYLVTVTDRKAIFQLTEYGWTRTVALELEVPDIK